MSEYKILKKVKLKAFHFSTSKTKHIVAGEEVPRPYELSIAQYEGDSGCYLFYLNDKGEEMTDTFHNDIEGAMEQAKWEFGIKNNEWQ